MGLNTPHTGDQLGPGLCSHTLPCGDPAKSHRLGSFTLMIFVLGLLFVGMSGIVHAESIQDFTLWNASVLVMSMEADASDSSPKAANPIIGTGTPTLLNSGCAIGTGCYSFDGNDAFNAGTARIFPSNNYMFCTWANISSSTGSGGSIIGQNAGDGTDYTFWRAKGSSGEHGTSWELPSPTVETLVGTDIQGVGWVHLCVAYNTTHLSLWENGTRVDTSALIEDTTNTNQAVFAIGGGYEVSYQDFMIGALDEMYWFNKSFYEPTYIYEGYKGTAAVVNYLYDKTTSLGNSSEGTNQTLFLLTPSSGSTFVYPLTSTINFTYNITANKTADLDNCSLYLNQTGILEINTTDNSPVNDSVNSFQNIPLTEGGWAWNVVCYDTAGGDFTSGTNFIINVADIAIDTCGTYTYPFMNISFKDEGNQSMVNSSYSTSLSWPTSTGTGSLTAAGTNESVVFCLSSNVTGLDVSAITTYSATDYPQRQKTVSAITSGVIQQVIHYLLKSSDGVYARFQIVDGLGNPVTGASGTQTRTIAGTPVITQAAITDDSGLITFWAAFNTEQTYTFNKTGVGTKAVTINPTSSDIIVVSLGSSTVEVVQPPSVGIRYGFSPVGLLQNGTSYNFKANVTSSYWTITDCDIFLYDNQTQIGTAAGSYTGTLCTANISYNVGDLSSITSKLIYEVNGTEQIVSQTYAILYTNPGNFTFKTFLDDLSGFRRAGFNQFTLVIIAIICIVAITAGVSQLGTDFRDPEVMVVIVMILTWGFSYIGWLGIADPNIPGEWLRQYIIAVLVSLAGGSYIISKHI